jgi:GWxTD domain-containing protein
LTTNQERDAFIADFWRRRDLTPATPVNEAKEEHYRRIAYANQRFASSIPGWKTDRGHVYILFGPPDVIESHPTGTTDTYPYDAWLYRRMEGIGENVTIEFMDPTLTGEYRLVLDRTEKKSGMQSGSPLDPAHLERWKKLQQRLAPKSN